MFYKIESLINEYGWNIGVWKKRYGSGFYGMISRQYFINEIEDILTGADIEACELEFYLSDKGSWLPIGSSDSIDAVLKELEMKIDKYLKNESWINKSEEVFEKIIEENDGNYGFKIALYEDKENFFKWLD